ncbi:MAG: 50S ribosomal protein L17 [Bacteriovoracaceae bacterium]|nr:50S ribosomal protein L17 [Bacteriovoracaceae bacterium]
MRHKRHKHTLGVSPSHRQSMIKNLAVELIDHGQIKTTATRCRALRPFIEKLVTIAKVDSIANRRLVYSKINNKTAVKQLFESVAPKFKTRPGGYIRITKLADVRMGDAAIMSTIGFVE